MDEESISSDKNSIKKSRKRNDIEKNYSPTNKWQLGYRVNLMVSLFHK